MPECEITRAIILYNAMIEKYITFDFLTNNNLAVIKEKSRKNSILITSIDIIFIIPTDLKNDDYYLNQVVFSTPDLYHLIDGNEVFPEYYEYFIYTVRDIVGNYIPFPPNLLDTQSVMKIRNIFKSYIKLYENTENISIQRFFWEIWIMILKLNVIDEKLELEIEYNQRDVYLGTIIYNQHRLISGENLIISVSNNLNSKFSNMSLVSNDALKCIEFDED